MNNPIALSDFSKARTGDKVWSLYKQMWGTITRTNLPTDQRTSHHICTLAAITVVFPGDMFEYGFDIYGRFQPTDYLSDLYHAEIHFKTPPPPKRMVKKTYYFNVYRTRNCGMIHLGKPYLDPTRVRNEGGHDILATSSIELEVEE